MGSFGAACHSRFSTGSIDGEVSVGWGERAQPTVDAGPPFFIRFVSRKERSSARGLFRLAGVRRRDGPQSSDFSLESEKEIALVSNLTTPSSFSDFAWHPGGAFFY